MKNRLISWLLAVSMLLAMLPVQALAIGSNPSPAERYTEYLLDGGYKAIMETTVSKSDLDVDSVLADVDGDGVQEALVHLTDTSFVGPRGYQCHCAVLDIENNQVVVRLQTYYGGGTLGGDMLYLQHDAQQDKYVLILDSTIRDGIYAGSVLKQLFNERYEVVLEVEYNYINLTADWYQDRVNKVKSETSHYKIDGDMLYYWTIDGKYVSEAAYDAQWDRFTLPNPEEDSPYAMYEGTYNKPIKLKTVPTWYEFDEDSYSFVNAGVSKIAKKYFTTMYEEAAGKLLYREKKDMADNGVCFGMAYTTASIHRQLPGVAAFMKEKLFGDDVTYSTLRELEKSSYFYMYSDNASGTEKVKLLDLIKYSHIYQLSSAVAASSQATWGDIDGLVEQVRDYLDRDIVGVTIGMTHVKMDASGNPVLDKDGNYITSGHRVLAVGIEGNDILIDDPNNTSDFERLTINEDGSWSYSGAWESDGVNSDNSAIRYQTDVTVPYLLISSGTTTTSNQAEDSDETYVEGMNRVDGDKVLLSVDSERYTLSKAVLPVVVDAGPMDQLVSDLYWVSSGSSIRVSGLGGDDSLVSLAGNDNLLCVGACEGSAVTMTVSDIYAGLLLESEVGEACTISLETTAADGEDLVVTIDGTVAQEKVTLAQTDTGVSYSGLSDVTVTLTKGEDSEISQTVAQEDAPSILVDYDRDGIAFEIHAYPGDRPTNPFVDVEQEAFYYDHVLWAVEKGITTGMTYTTFEPLRTCNRAQVVTFLWRAAGSPKPVTKENPFKDVTADQYHYEAVLWAAENGITNGMKPGYFCSEENCTRGQVATFLWRTLGEPEAKSSDHPFTDLDEDAFYYEAVLWAAENDITNGMTPTTFAPNASCTRGQIVTFLHRAMEE